eukprot:TRINITY_DN9067_c0_g1_i1.p1 TRINITY_DN9067_c0_g1~~TRINITY_DN9067_c0_g1_i1.p1  ORF type:complete len:196 (+),score=75.44 TRINITY_DN9067_c0_g1_i1:78-665(+)
MSESSEEDTGYKPGEKVDIKTLVNQDNEDESLRKYKESLLGNVNDIYAPKDDPRRVVIIELKIIFQDRPNGDVVYNLEDKNGLEKLKNDPFTIKEGAGYRIQVKFRVQHEIVSGLKYENKVYKGIIRAAVEREMLGSFGPQKEPHTVAYPRRGWEEAPSGTLARGKYKAKSRYYDDDKQCHLKYDYCFEIKKEWD